MDGQEVVTSFSHNGSTYALCNDGKYRVLHWEDDLDEVPNGATILDYEGKPKEAI